jgi:hypothetical protein
VARRLKGAHCHIIVGSQGLLIGVSVTQTNLPKRLGAVVVLHEAEPRIVAH